MARMASSPAVSQADWLGACRAAVAGLRAVLRAHPTSRERVIETGTRGEGGDRTLVIDQQAEDIVFEQLERLHDAGARFTAVSEERGVVDFGGDGVLVVIDPIDGSMNAKRGLTHHALSIAVADGPTMADVQFGYVFDLGPGEEWRAELGGGALLDDQPVRPQPQRRTADGKLELIAIESADPRLTPSWALRPPEAADGHLWLELNPAGMQASLAPLLERALSDGPAGAGPVGAAGGAVIAVEVGALSGYLARRVLGQYELQ